MWGDGNILLGGGGSDLIEGRGGDDIIDGDRYLNVRLSVRDPENPATEIGSAAGMTVQYQRDGLGALTGPTLQEAVFAGTVNPGDIVAVREILTGSGGTDTAVFSGPRSNYTIESTPATDTELAKVTVTQTGADVAGQKASDGIDTLRNVELLRFTDETVDLNAPEPVILAPAAPGIASVIAGDTTATLRFTAPAGEFAAASFTVAVREGDTVVRTIEGIAPTETSLRVVGLTNGTAYNFQVRAVNEGGESPWSDTSDAVTPSAPVVVPPVFVPPAVSPFADVLTDHTFYKEIAWLADRRISNGWPGANNTATYRAGENVNRDQMAAFLYRMSGTTDYTAPAVSPFTDVPTSHTFYKEIAWLADQGISKGWPGANNTATFRPGETINRDQMAAFLYRMSGTTDYTAPAVSPFSDAPTSHTFYKEIAWLADKGISNGWPGANNTATYRAGEKINRDQMAAFLYRMSHPTAG